MGNRGAVIFSRKIFRPMFIPVNERLLQFIWQFQYFDAQGLQTLAEEPVTILAPGKLNRDQGPDFSAARIQIGPASWSGNVEIHIQSSDWYRHHHEEDRTYGSVILHVVWKYDGPPQTIQPDIPTIELHSRVANILLDRYEQLIGNGLFIPCEKSLHHVKEIVWINWKERLLVERLQRKSAYVLELLAQSKFHWEETFWWMLARNFGILVNADAFEAIARSIPLTLLVRHKNQIHQLEALLFGQAGLLGRRFTESYPLLLQREYRFHRKKYRLKPVQVPLKFLRMRPSAFPSLRLAQLAMLIHTSTHLLSAITEKESVSEVKSFLQVTANDYWHYHYRFEEETAYKMKQVGEDMIRNILINTIVPVLFAYGRYRKEERLVNRALRWMQEIAAEKNRITQAWAGCGMVCKTASDSQSLLELKTSYCDEKRCLDCSVGNALLKPMQ